MEKPARILIPLSDGFEETEAVTTIDILRRAGLDATTVSTSDNLLVRGAHAIFIRAQESIGHIDPDAYDGVAIPGGMDGTRRNRACRRLLDAIRRIRERGRVVAAICAAPAVLEAAGVFTPETRFTCYPGLEAECPTPRHADGDVVSDGKIVTSRGPGTSAKFALEIVRLLAGDDKAADVARGFLLD